MDSTESVTRISHRLSAATSHMLMSPALHLNSLLNILTNMPASPVLRAPCIHEHLRGFATKSCEKSGLTRISHRLSAATLHMFMSTALHLNSLLNRLTNMPASPVLRAPCIHEHLQGFATKPCAKSGFFQWMGYLPDGHL